MNDRMQSVLLDLQNALLGEVSEQLRAVTVSFEESTVHFDAFFYREVGEEDLESMSVVETGVMAMLPASQTITHSVHTLDSDKPLPTDHLCVFARRPRLL